MPQIWMTYVEVGHMMGCHADLARDHAIREGWSRKKSGDGLSRTKLPPEEAESYLERMMQQRLDALLASPSGARAVMRRLAAPATGERNAA